VGATLALAQALVYVDGCKGVVLLFIVDIRGCVLLNVALHMLSLRQATLDAHKMHYLTTVCFENQTVVDVRFRQDNAMFMFNHVSMRELCAYALHSQDCGNDNECQKSTKRKGGGYP
jgi:hypothetical protein